jgi:3-deoxy-D-manno-octulosonic-acid transferase
MMRRLYSVLFALAVPALLLRLALKGIRDSGYWRHWSERFAVVLPRLPATTPVLWVHAVSVGEVQAAVPLIMALKLRHANCRILVTTTTPTGRRRVAQVFGDSVDCCYLPFDILLCLRRFLAGVQPAVGVILETELWPNVIECCRDKGIPLVLANARLSERSAAGYRRFASLSAQMLSRLSLIAVQSQDDAERLIQLGARADRMVLTGNLKLDVHISASAPEAAQVLRRAWGQQRSVWIAASTHSGEEEIALKVHRELLNNLPGALLVLVPRHPERTDAIVRLCEKAGLSHLRRSEGTAPTAGLDVYIGDTMGDLLMLYAAADVAFVGGSLVERGGHNLLEPAALAVPVILGPHMFNFAELSRRVTDLGIARRINDGDELRETLTALLSDPELRHEMGQQGKQFVEASRGALPQLLEALAPIIRASL